MSAENGHDKPSQEKKPVEAVMSQAKPGSPMPELVPIGLDDALDMMLDLKKHPHMDISQNPAKIESVRLAAKEFIKVILLHCPNSLDRMTAIRTIRQGLMMAEASINTPQVTV